MYGLKEIDLKTIYAFLGLHPEIEKAVLFGSRALGTYKPASDIDIALYGQGVDHLLAIALKSNIENGSAIPYFVDFVAYPAIKNEALKEHIDRYGIELWRADNAQAKSNQTNI
jgi:predicted nucleotidyltransferase